MTFRCPSFDDVLAARKADPAIATTHDGSLHWNNGRSNSRRLLTPDQAARWNVANAPARPKKQEASAEPARVGAPAEVAAMAPAHPARLPRPGQTIVPEEVQRGLDALCGNFCDLSPVIVANLRETAARHGKEFPDQMVVEVCTWFLEAMGKEKVGTRYVPETSILETVYRYKVDMPAAFLRKCALDDTHSPLTTNWKKVLNAVDHYERRRAKNERELHEKAARCIQMLRKTPADESVLDWAEQLDRDAPEKFNELWREDDLKHGGDGSGSSFSKDLMEKVLKGVRGPP
jgi:hypothetical protein